MNPVVRRFGTLGLSLALAACQGVAALDLPPPPSDWRPQGVNAANIAAMAAHPGDLVRGHGDPGRTAQDVTTPVLRLWSDRVKPLPGSPLDMGGSGDASGGSAGAAPSAPASAAPSAGSPPSPPVGGS